LRETDWIETFVLKRAGDRSSTDFLGPGDDAALLPPIADECTVLSVDALIEGQHFRSDWLDDRALARRLLRSSVSDLAAMGARPRGFLLSIETPELPGRVGDQFWRGIDEECQQLDLQLLGGNVARSGEALALHCTCVGTVAAERQWRRSGACAGDVLVVTGNPGRAAQARERIASGEDLGATDPWSAPQPRLQFATTLAGALAQADGHRQPAAIDISDGLMLDLKRLCEANHCCARIDIGALVEPDGSPLTEQVLGGGEDYELLLAIEPAAWPILEQVAAQTGTAIHQIGTFTAEAHDQIEVWNGEQKIGAGDVGWDPCAASKNQ
jgi:thiamine-monophosphate kinase